MSYFEHPGMPYCPDCGSEIDPDNVYCSNCGRQLDGGQSGGDPDDAGGWDDGGDDRRSDDGGGDDWGGQDSGGDDWAEASSGDDWSDSGEDSYGNPEQPAGGRSGRGGGQPGQGRGSQPGQGRGGGQPRQGRGGGGQPGQGRGGQGQGGGWEGGQGQGGWEGGQGQSQRREWGGTDVQSGDDVYIEDGRVNFAVKFPYSDGWGALGISALCYIGSFLIVPLFIVIGYLYRITEAAAWGDTLQPRFDEYGEMIKSGFFMFLLYLVYGVIGTVVFGGLVVVGAQAGAESAAVLLGLVFGLVWAYFGPAVLTLYPVTGSFSEALSPSRITDFAFTEKYFGAFLLFIALNFAIQLVFTIAIFVLAITVIGIFLAIPLSIVFAPYVIYLTGSYWGATYYEAAQEGLVDPPWEEEQAQQDTYGGGEQTDASTW
jgi:hypothetical protein